MYSDEYTVALSPEMLQFYTEAIEEKRRAMRLEEAGVSCNISAPWVIHV